MDSRQWDRIAPEFESKVYDIVAIDTAGTLRRLVRRACMHGRAGVLVDLGCGIGSFVRAFARPFASVVGIDYSRAMLERARRRCRRVENARWICGDIASVTSEITASADLTVCINVITSPRASEREDLWSAVASVTKPGGSALVVVPALESAEMIAEVANSHRALSGDEVRDLVDATGDLQKYYTQTEVAEAVTRQGLVIEMLETLHYPWAEEDTTAPQDVDATPWDWAILARRPSNVVPFPQRRGGTVVRTRAAAKAPHRRRSAAARG